MRKRAPVLVVGALAALVVVLLAAAELAAPGVAERRLRDRLARSGEVLSVTVRAFPAVKLIFGHADSVTIRLATVRLGVGRAGSLIAMTAKTSKLDLTARQVVIGPLALDNATVTKDAGGGLLVAAMLSNAALESALPPALSLTPVPGPDGELRLRGRVSLFGLNATAEAALSARDGRLVIQPVGVPFAGLVNLTVFSDPHVSVDSVGATPVAGGYELTARVHLV